jgi:hypothetical protein
VYGLGEAVYNWLVMRLGVETVKPDVRLHRFLADAIGRAASDSELVTSLIRVAELLHVTPRQLDWSIWEARASGRETTSSASSTFSGSAAHVAEVVGIEAISHEPADNAQSYLDSTQNGNIPNRLSDMDGAIIDLTCLLFMLFSDRIEELTTKDDNPSLQAILGRITDYLDRTIQEDPGR